VSCALVLVPIASILPGDARLHAGIGPLFALVAVAGPCLVLGRVLAAVNNGYGQPIHNAQAAMAGLLVKLIVGAFLIYSFGALGAAATMIVTTAAITAVAGFHAIGCWREPEILPLTRTA